MFTSKMRLPAPSAEFKFVARLPGYVLRFNKHSQDDGSGKGNIVATGNAEDEVWGVIFEIANRDRNSLDDSEGGYNPVMVDVVSPNGPLSARTYVARPNRVNDALRPYTWYKEYVVCGAQQHSLPQSYIERLETVESVEDPVKERRERHQALLAELG